MPLIAFVTNIVPHYRTSFYQKLADCSEYQFHLIRGLASPDDARPDVQHAIGIPETLVKNSERRLGPFTIRWQSGVMSEIKRLMPDIIVLLGISGTVSNWIVASWAKRRRIPVLIWACGWEPQANRPASRKLKDLLASQYFRKAEHILSYSTKGKSYIEHLGVPATRVEVCYNGLDIAMLVGKEHRIRTTATQLRNEFCAQDKVVFLFVGAVAPGKGIDLLLRAYSRVERTNPQCVLWIVGDGPDRPAMESIAARLGLTTVRFLGRIVENVDPFFAAADYVVLPGLGGLAFNQAMFLGTPCIAGEADGTEDDLVIEGVTGKRFTPGDEDSLTSALIECARQERSTRNEWSTRCEELIRNRSNVDQMVCTFRLAFSRLLQASSAQQR